MHAFDIVFCLFAAIFIIVGIRRGFIEEVVRLIALVAGFLCGLLLYRQLVPKLSFLSLPPHVAGVVAFLCIFFACTIVLLLLGKIIKKIISLTMLGWLDRLGGGCIGAVKTAVIGWIFVIAATSLPMFCNAKFFRDSRVFSFFVTISPGLKAQVLRHAQLPPSPHAGQNTLGLPNAIINAFKGFGGVKDSVGRTEPIKKKHHFDEKNAL